MWTKKGVLILSAAVLLILFGAMFRNIPLLGVSIVLLSYTVVSVLSNRTSQLYPSRQTSNEKIFEDGSVKVELRLLNQGGKTGFLEVRDKLPREMDTIRGSNYTFLNLNPAQDARIRYTVKCPIKGVYHLGPIQVRSHDPFNMFYTELEAEYDTTLTVFPQTREVKELYLKSRQPKIYPGEMRVKMPGPGYEFFSIRDYIPGDPFKNINWKAYASTGRLLVNEHERESVSDITLVFDSRAVSNYGMTSDNANLYGARAAATLANFFLKRRDTVQLVIYSDKVQTVKKGGGQKQLFEILTSLAGANPKGDIPLNGIVEVALPYMPRQSPVIIISSLDEDETLRKAISTMRVLEFDVTIISPSSIDFEMMAREHNKDLLKKVDPISFEVIKLEREITMNELRGYGVRVVDWKPEMPLIQVLLEARNVPTRGGGLIT
jgi:uncharacterized protein (DUF58 family)